MNKKFALDFDFSGIKKLIRCLPWIALSTVLLITGCSNADSWPETLYLDRLFVGGAEVSAAPASAFNTIIKSQDEIVNNSIVMQADDELLVDFEAGTNYIVNIGLIYKATQVADIKFNLTCTGNVWSLSTAGNVNHLSIGLSRTVTAIGYAGTTNTISMGGNESERTVVLIDMIISAKNDTTMSLNWAQNTAETSNTTMLSGSFIEWREIN